MLRHVCVLFPHAAVSVFPQHTTIQTFKNGKQLTRRRHITPLSMIYMIYLFQGRHSRGLHDLHGLDIIMMPGKRRLIWMA